MPSHKLSTPEYIPLDNPFKWSETFLSIEGEGPYSGVPTAYVRLVGCNLTCLFNMPNNEEYVSNELLGFDPDNYDDVSEIPPIVHGCDSIYSWDMRFSHMWKRGTALDIINELEDLLPDKNWHHPKTKLQYFMSITGGEPLLHWKSLPELLNHHRLVYVPKIIETNGSFCPPEEFWNEVWNETFYDIIWSISPKLESSSKMPNSISFNASFIENIVDKPFKDMYFKFVVNGPEQLKEVEQYLQYLNDRKINVSPERIYLMPEGCTTDQQNNVAEIVAEMCIERGYRYCHRVHLDVYGNAIGK